MKKKLCLLMVLLPVVSFAQKQCSDFGIWTSIGAEKKLNKKWSVGVETEMRTRDNTSTIDRWSFGVNGEYKATKRLKFGAGYELLYDHNEKYTYKTNGDLNKYANYWGLLHRLHFDVTGNLNFGKWNLALRERWQYTYRPEKTIAQRYDFDDEDYDGKAKTYSGKGKNQLRSRLQLKYKTNINLYPYVSAEMYNAWNIEKMRYTLGVDWDITKHHEVGTYYRFQRTYGSDEESDNNVFGVSYYYKF